MRGLGKSSGFGCAEPLSGPTIFGMRSLNGAGLSNDSVFGLRRLNGVADYDHISIGGVQFSVNQILDKSITANRDLIGYSYAGTDANKVKKTIKKGQVIGKVYSYIKPSATNGGVAWLMFGDTFENSFFIPADGANVKLLQDQGAQTVQQEVAAEKEAKEKEESPILYYFKKVGVPVLLTGAGIYVAVQLGKVVLEKKLTPAS